jgi:hypothetical protein
MKKEAEIKFRDLANGSSYAEDLTTEQVKHLIGENGCVAESGFDNGFVIITTNKGKYHVQRLSNGTWNAVYYTDKPKKKHLTNAVLVILVAGSLLFSSCSGYKDCRGAKAPPYGYVKTKGKKG